MTNGSRPPVGALLMTTTPPEQLPALARQAEAGGLGELWVAEDYFFYGGFTAMQAVLQATDEIPVGLGIISAVARHPAVTAMEIANIARSFPGRGSFGIGHGLPAWTQQMGLLPKSPLTALRECVEGVRDLLSGQELTRKGDYFDFNAVALAHPVDGEVPILTGVLGPKSLDLSGRIADGTVISVLAASQYVAWAREKAEAGMAAAGRSGHHRLPTFAISVLDRDGRKARETVKAVLAFYLAAVGPSALTAAYGANDDLKAMLAKGGPEVVAAEMPDQWVEDLAVAGDPDEVTAKIRAMLDAGADSVVLAFQPPEAASDQIDLLAEAVLPNFS